MEFLFLDHGRLVDRELELVAPDARYVDDVLSACAHPMSAGDPQASAMTPQRITDFLRLAPGGHQRGDSADRATVPSYHFWMRLSRIEAARGPMPPWGAGDPPVRMAGGIGLRIGNTRDLQLYYGHVGYNVFPPARGNHYAERACRLLLPLARAHGLDELWITCNPDNLASRRTCERLGCALVDIVQVPVGHPLHLRGEREKCRYRLNL